MALLFNLLFISAVISAGTFLYVWVRLYQKLHLHVASDPDVPENYNLSYKKVSFQTSDDAEIAGWYFPVKNPKAVVIVVHGRAVVKGGKSSMLEYAKFLTDSGYAAFLIDLRSNGESLGNQVTLGVKEWRDVEGAYDFVYAMPENKKIKIGYLGVSMGAASSIISAGKSGKGNFLIASVPYASFESLFTRQLQKERLFAQLFLPFLQLAASIEFGPDYARYAPLNFIKSIHMPIVLFSASNDQEVDSNDAQLLFDNANAPKEYWQAGSKHNIIHYQPQEFIKHVLSFLDKYAS